MEVLHQVGDIIAERYRITGILGQGGIGITYAAEDLRSSQQVALKALSMRQMGEWKVLELFEREAKVLAQLNHPAIPRYIDYFQVDTPEDRGFYIAQELAEGKSLAELVEIGWRTNESGVRKIATQVLEILVYLHSLKPPVVHRDIKPRNLIWGKDGKIFLVDFGAVQDTYRSTLARGSTIVGTYGYMAPEQFRGQAVPATDLYGLGTTVLFLLTHRSPADLPQERLKINFRSRIQVSEGFANWLEKMLEPDVEERFSSAKEALEALQGRMTVAKPRQSVSWKVMTGVGVAATIAVIVLNSYKWTVLGAIGFNPWGICEAASSGKFDVIRDYLKHGGDLDAKDSGEIPIKPCLLKMKNATKDIAELVISKLPDVNAKDSEGEMPLHIVGSQEMAKLLIAKGADVNAKDNQGETPLDKAFKDTSLYLPSYLRRGQIQSQINLLKLLIGKGAYATKVNAKDSVGKTLLYNATATGEKELVELLIAQGADVNTKISPLIDQVNKKLRIVLEQSEDGSTPLQAAAEYGHTNVVQLLLAHGADINAKSNNGMTALHRAAAQGHRDVAELLIARGAQVNARDNEGNTPLHMTGSQKVAELLTDKGAELKAKNNQGETALHLAIRNLNIDLAEFLIAKGIDVDVRNNQAQTPLHWAIKNSKKTVWFSSDGKITRWIDSYGFVVEKTPNSKNLNSKKIQSKDVAALLISKGANVNAKDNQGKTPLLLVVEGDVEEDIKKDLAELLISRGADINTKDNQGHTPLQVAILDECSCSRDIVKLLILKGADVNVQSAKDYTPMHLAAGYNWKDIGELLIAKGADVNATEFFGLTPLDIATMNGQMDMVKLLTSHGGISHLCRKVNNKIVCQANR